MISDVFCVMGLGNIAGRHRRNLKMMHPKGHVISISASGRIPESMPDDCDFFVESIDDAIKMNPRFAVIASPSPMHLDHSLQFLKANIPVLVEKPLTAEYEDGLKLAAAADTYGTPVAVAYCLRFMPSALKIKQLLQTNIIGTIFNINIIAGEFLPNWRASKDYKDSVSVSKHLGGGVLLELSHELDYARWLLGDLSVEFSSLNNSKTLNLEVEEVADILLTNAAGLRCYVHLDFLQSPAYRVATFIGEKGRLEWDLATNTVKLITISGEEMMYSDDDWERNQMYVDMLNQFDGYIHGKPLGALATIEDGVAVVGLVGKIKSLSNKGLFL